MNKQLHHRGFHRFHTTNTNYIMMPCLAVWYPDLPHYRLLPKSKPLRAAALQCLPSRMHHRRQCSLWDSHMHTHTHAHSCGPGVGGDLTSGAQQALSSPPTHLFDQALTCLHNKLFSHQNMKSSLINSIRPGARFMSKRICCLMSE